MAKSDTFLIALYLSFLEYGEKGEEICGAETLVENISELNITIKADVSIRQTIYFN